MQLKKYLSIALVVVMLLSCMIAAVACGTEEEPTKEQPTQEQPTKEQPTQEQPTQEQPTKEQPTQEHPTEDPDEGKVEYSVTVTDQDGNAVVGAMIQICIKDSTCLNPMTVDENGVAKIMLEERDDYQTKIFRAPEGYTYSTDYTDFLDETSVTIVITSVCQHVAEIIPAVPATCTENGSTEGAKCSICGDILKSPETVPASHTAEPATCTKNSTCTVCGKKLADRLGHSYNTVYDTACAVCSEERDVPQLVAKVFEGLAVGNISNTFAGYTDTVYRGATVESVDQTNGQVVIPKFFAGVKLSINGFAGYKSTVSNFGYYFDTDSNNIVNGVSGTPTDAMKSIAGTRAKTFNISVDTTELSAGEHTITFVVQFGSGICVDLTTWNITVVSKEVSSDKPIANVIIVSGQSNAYGASPITDAVRAEFENKTFNNVYIHYNNINVKADSSADGGTWQTIYSNNEFEQYRLGVGAQGPYYLGPELGIVDYLTSNGYADEAPLYIIKFTAAGTFLNGQWFETKFTHYNGGLDPFGLVDDMGDYLYNQMVNYIDESLAMIPDEYDIHIQSFFWVQGESDSGVPDVAAAYGEYERMLVSSIRSDYVEYAAPDGISFVNYAIAETPEGNITWAYASTINNCKKDNCGVCFDPEAEEGNQITINENPGIKNSYIVLADVLRSKGTAGDIEGGAPSVDFAHMCGEDMVILGRWMGEGMLYLENVSNAD